MQPKRGTCGEYRRLLKLGHDVRMRALEKAMSLAKDMSLAKTLEATM